MTEKSQTITVDDEDWEKFKSICKKSGLLVKYQTKKMIAEFVKDHSK